MRLVAKAREVAKRVAPKSSERLAGKAPVVTHARFEVALRKVTHGAAVIEQEDPTDIFRRCL